MNKRTWILGCACLLLTFSACDMFGPPVSREEFLASEKEKGFVLLGEFGKAWPAKPVEESTAEDSIAFELASGARHSYPGYEGYTLKVVRLKGPNGAETVLVLRSAEKRRQ